MDAEDQRTADQPAFNLMNQKIGSKGAATRQQILDTAVRLVDMQTGESPSISTICRESSVSKATFYQYFEDFRSLIVALLRPVSGDIDVLAQMVAEPWPEQDTFDRAYDFVTAYFELCTKYRVAFRLRNHAADSGDADMILRSLRAADPIMRELATKICAARQGERASRNDYSLAIALMHALSSAAMFLTRKSNPKSVDEVIEQIHGSPRDYQQRAVAHLITLALSRPELPRKQPASAG